MSSVSEISKQSETTVKINVSLIFFGPLKDYFQSEKNIHIDLNTDIKTILDMLIDENKSSEALLRASRAAVDNEFVDLSRNITEGDEIYFLPPASGG